MERLTGEISTEINQKNEPIYTCDYENSVNNDIEYDLDCGDDGDDGSDNEEETLTLKRRLKDLESVEKKNEAAEIELKTVKMEAKPKEVKKEEEEKVDVPDFVKGLLAGRYEGRVVIIIE